MGDNGIMWPNQDETQRLLDQAKGGDRDAANGLLERHRDVLRRMVEARLDARIKRRVDASDIVQDVLVDANRRLQEYLENPQMAFLPWLRHIAQDRMIDAHRRHRGSAKRSVDREQAITSPMPDRSTMELAAQLRDAEMTPATAATMQELQKRFLAAIETLNDQDREIILMRHFEQLTNQEAAESLGLTPPAASMRYMRAIQRLRGSLGDVLEDGS